MKVKNIEQTSLLAESPNRKFSRFELSPFLVTPGEEGKLETVQKVMKKKADATSLKDFYILPEEPFEE